MRARRCGDREGGNLLVLEALIVGVLLLTAMLLASTPPPPEPPTGGRRNLELAVRDLLAHYQTAPESTGTFASMLERIVAEGLQGNDSLLDSRLRRALPSEVVYNLQLDNGRGLHKLRWDREPSGEAVSGARLWSPAWGPILAVPGVRLLDAERGGLWVQAMPVLRALGLGDEPGLTAEVEVELPGGQRRNLTGSAPLANRTTPGPGASLAFLDSAGRHVAVVAPGDGNQSLFLVVNETQGRALPADTLLELSLPPGFRSVDLAAGDNPGWGSLSTTGNASAGWVLKARTTSALSEGTLRLKANATLPTWGRVHAVEAVLDQGALGRLHGVLLNATAPMLHPGLAPARGPYLSAPGLAPHSDWAAGAVVVANPDDQARTLTVKRVTLTAQAGASLLDARGAEPSAGWVRTPDQLEWTGSRALASNDALEFRFEVMAHAPARGGDPAGPLKADLRNGHAPQAWLRSHPGLLHVRAAPANASAEGFPTAAGAKDLLLNLTHEDTLLKGDAAFEVVANDAIKASAGDVARGWAESWLRPDAARAEAGGSVVVRWDLARLVEELGVQAAQFKCYTSASGAWAWRADRADCNANGGLAWQFDHEAPAVSLRQHAPAPANASADRWPLLQSVGSLASAGSHVLELPRGTLLGTHVLELRAEFEATDTGAGSVKQRVSLLWPLDVHPPGRDAPAAPQYSVVLQAWLPDWG